MSSKNAVPSSLSGIKRRAKALSRESDIPYHIALDAVSKEAGYQNIRHAQNTLSNQGPLTHTSYLTAYWSQRGGRGRETLALHLPVPLSDIVSRHQLSSARNLQSFRLESSDHLERRVDTESREQAHDILFAAARTVRFMAATALRPATTQKQINLLANIFQTLPGRDHPSEWIDKSGTWVFMDEPYFNRDLEERRAWLESSGIQMINPTWEGLHAPSHSIPFIFCNDSALLNHLQVTLAQLQRNSTEPKWDGESASYGVPFISPARKASGLTRRRRPMPAYPGVAKAGALPYGARTGGQQSLWRPEHRMALESHLTVGPLLYALDNGSLPKRARNAIAYLRTTLDDWLQMEYPTNEEMTSEQFHQAYYGAYREPIEERKKQIETVHKITELISSGYLECKPRAQILKALTDIEKALDLNI